MLDQEFYPRLRTPASIRSLLPRWPQPSERAVLPRTQARSPRPRPAWNFGTHAQFPVGGTLTLACETSVAFSAQPNANTVIDFGLFQRGASAAFAPLDGVYFRMNSAGMFGVVNSGGVETTTAVFRFRREPEHLFIPTTP